MRRFTRTRRLAGFTLIELLIVVAIIGVIAAIAVPNLMQAMDRTKQKATMADIRTLGTAIQQYAIDVNFYPRNFSSLTPVATGLRPYVEPSFLPHAPTEDGWGGQLYYQSPAGNTYTLISYGKDKVRSPGSFGHTTDFDCDIIFQENSWVASPSGVQN